MKSLILSVVFALFSVSAQAQTFDREYAFFALLDMGYDVSEEDMGEMFKNNIFILSNSWVCDAVGAMLYDDSGSSCLLQVKPDGSIGGFYSTNPNALYEDL